MELFYISNKRNYWDGYLKKFAIVLIVGSFDFIFTNYKY